MNGPQLVPLRYSSPGSSTHISHSTICSRIALVPIHRCSPYHTSLLLILSLSRDCDCISFSFLTASQESVPLRGLKAKVSCVCLPAPLYQTKVYFPSSLLFLTPSTHFFSSSPFGTTTRLTHPSCTLIPSPPFPAPSFSFLPAANTSSIVNPFFPLTGIFNNLPASVST